MNSDYSPPPPPPTCPNCRAVVVGEYCVACGQHQRAKTFTLAEMLHDSVHEIVHADGRLHHTTVSLLWRPGEFAKDWLEGRRARHLPPIRTYIVVTLVLFFCFGAMGRSFELDPQARAEVQRRDQIDIDIDTGLTRVDAALEARLQAQVDHFLREPAALASTVLDLAPQIGSLVVPLVAIALYALFRAPSLRYGHHLIAALSLQTGAFLWLLLAVLLQGIARLVELGGAATLAQWISWPAGLVPPLLLLYVLVGLRAVYGHGWMSTTARAVALATVYAVLATLALTATLFVAFLVF